MNLIETILLATLVILIFAVPFTIVLWFKKTKQPACNKRKFKCRKNFHKHGQDDFKNNTTSSEPKKLT